jgi:hypothetical protein
VLSEFYGDRLSWCVPGIDVDILPIDNDESPNGQFCYLYAAVSTSGGISNSEYESDYITQVI